MAVPLTGNMMASILWDEKGTLLSKYLSKLLTITGEYTAGLLDKLDQIMKKECPYLAEKNISGNFGRDLFQQRMTLEQVTVESNYEQHNSSDLYQANKSSEYGLSKYMEVAKGYLINIISIHKVLFLNLFSRTS